MSAADQPENRRPVSLNRSRVARAIFAAAESMGMRDRQIVERLTAQVIERLEKPQAFVVLKGGSGEEVLGDLKDFVKESIGKWKYPRWIDVIDELPKTATGKVQRFKLREGSQ